MPVRSTMAALIARVRILINDPAGASQVFDDSTIQDVMDESRADYKNEVLIPKPTFAGSQIQFLDYYHALGGWEDDLIIKQYLINQVTPATSEPIAAHWTFSATTLPPLYISGKLYDVYRAAADLLERQAAMWVLRYNVNVDGQSLQRSQASMALQNLARTYRMKQRAGAIHVTRTDIRRPGQLAATGLGPLEIDYLASGNKDGS
ncbi:MAG: hypothetical protein WB562_20415 [Candidatus Sulfotelmatobacter sp.]